jgi:hypothetical protein
MFAEAFHSMIKGIHIAMSVAEAVAQQAMGL